MADKLDIKEDSLESFLKQNTKGDIAITLNVILESLSNDSNNTIYIETDNEVVSVLSDPEDASGVVAQKMDKKTLEYGKSKKIKKKDEGAERAEILAADSGAHTR